MVLFVAEARASLVVVLIAYLLVVIWPESNCASSLPIAHVPTQVDVNRLPAPAESSDGGAYVAPRSQTEQVLQGVWQEVLGLSQPPSVEADFFADLGGSSLQVCQS
jgi:hypothetical protein